MQSRQPELQLTGPAASGWFSVEFFNTAQFSWKIHHLWMICISSLCTLTHPHTLTNRPNRESGRHRLKYESLLPHRLHTATGGWCSISAPPPQFGFLNTNQFSQRWKQQSQGQSLMIPDSNWNNSMKFPAYCHWISLVLWVLAAREACSRFTSPSSFFSSYIKDTTGFVIEDGFFAFTDIFFGLIHFSFLRDIRCKVALATFCQSSLLHIQFFFFNLHTMTPSHIPESNPWLSESKLSHSAVLVLCKAKK